MYPACSSARAPISLSPASRHWIRCTPAATSRRSSSPSIALPIPRCRHAAARLIRITHARSPPTVATATPTSSSPTTATTAGSCDRTAAIRSDRPKAGASLLAAGVVPQPDGGIEVIGVEVAHPPRRHRISVPSLATAATPRSSAGRVLDRLHEQPDPGSSYCGRPRNVGGCPPPRARAPRRIRLPLFLPFWRLCQASRGPHAASWPSATTLSRAASAPSGWSRTCWRPFHVCRHHCTTDILGLFPPGSRVDSDGELVVGGCRLADLAAEWGTPLYVIDEAGSAPTSAGSGGRWTRPGRTPGWCSRPRPSRARPCTG